MHHLPPEQLLALGALVVLIGAALIALAVIIGPPRKRPAPPPARTPPPPPDPVYSQVGFMEVDGRVVPLRTLVRQSQIMDAQRLAEINKRLPPPR